MLVDVVRMSKVGKRDKAHDFLDSHLPLIRYEQQPGSVARSAQICNDRVRYFEPRHPSQTGYRAVDGGSRRDELFTVTCRSSRLVTEQIAVAPASGSFAAFLASKFDFLKKIQLTNAFSG